MGSGKSSIGKALAKESSFYFLDTDSMIESAEGKSIDCIFKDASEAYFRSLEEDTVRWLKTNVSEAIISTGGGMLVYCEELQEVGKIVYLKVPFESIMSRMSDTELAKRPLFQNRAKAEELYKQRDSIYENRADVIINADTNFEDVLRLVKKALSF